MAMRLSVCLSLLFPLPYISFRYLIFHAEFAFSADFRAKRAFEFRCGLSMLYACCACSSFSSILFLFVMIAIMFRTENGLGYGFIS